MGGCWARWDGSIGGGGTVFGTCDGLTGKLDDIFPGLYDVHAEVSF